MASPQARSSASLRNSVLGSAARGSKSLGFLSCFPQDDERISVILIRHGQTEFNRVFSVTRRDPGIRDPHLADLGRRQAASVAQALRPSRLRKLISSPYTRALETAGIIAEHLGLPISVEPLIAERFFSHAISAHPWPSFVRVGRILALTICGILGGLSWRKPRRRLCTGPRPSAAKLRRMFGPTLPSSLIGALSGR
jgi:histidine phosphatase superfamily protein (branch 1)